MRKYSSIAIANWFIDKGLQEHNPVDLLKLLKLVYIAQGAALVKGQVLFDDPIEAWKFGPVVSKIYHAYKHNGNNPIISFSQQDCEVEKTKGNDTIACQPAMIESTDGDTHDLLDSIWSAFAEFTGVQLVNWSHDQEGPWYVEYETKQGKKKHNHVIPNQNIAAYFKGKLSENPITA